jgi:Leucine-rich repeat (LRR) protein
MSNNELITLPRHIGYLGRVMKLNISNNKLRELPMEIGAMDGRLFWAEMYCINGERNEQTGMKRVNRK